MRTAGKANRKTKKSYTLSPESVAFLEKLRKEHSESISSILEGILQAQRREQERSCLESAVADYYSSLKDSDVADHAEWGQFALQQFPKERT